MPSVPLWALLVFALWAAIVALGLRFGDGEGGGLVLCHFKRLTGRPCPSCGSSRGVLAALHGDLVEAWAWNPLVMSVLGILATLTLLRLATAKRLEVELDPPARWLLWSLGLVALAANWWWIWDRA